MFLEQGKEHEPSEPTSSDSEHMNFLWEAGFKDKGALHLFSLSLSLSLSEKAFKMY